jgi:hypothetical protein
MLYRVGNINNTLVRLFSISNYNVSDKIRQIHTQASHRIPHTSSKGIEQITEGACVTITHRYVSQSRPHAQTPGATKRLYKTCWPTMKLGGKKAHKKRCDLYGQLIPCFFLVCYLGSWDSCFYWETSAVEPSLASCLHCEAERAVHAHSTPVMSPLQPTRFQTLSQLLILPTTHDMAVT